MPVCLHICLYVVNCVVYARDLSWMHHPRDNHKPSKMVLLVSSFPLDASVKSVTPRLCKISLSYRELVADFRIRTQHTDS